ncbi:hypothetical protein DSM03_102472 [Leeuwenhoekiella aestuarii]|uniref:hypothetical protein n=1 Tax=Leeuwenhoekiella aestuarii TaxID=2249426 RepID=UPI000FFF2F21|nr:hypothetical protein [Leeuwenhoekiella aestuarii]RXG17595.1 hypothetical protein DSM03_102472 [Leeuwenhoekiella aestuarii]
MHYKIFILVTCICAALKVSAQVGINTTNPSTDVDVNGFTIIEKKLYLEDPGESTQIRGSRLLIQRTDNSIVQYNLDISKYGPINYAELVLKATNKNGVEDFDTKIPIDPYNVTLQGYYFLDNNNNGTSVITQSTNGDDKIEGFQAYAYKGSTTWHIKVFVNNSIFRVAGNNDIKVDIYINLIIFRKGLLAKEMNAVEVDLENKINGTAELPSGF